MTYHGSEVPQNISNRAMLNREYRMVVDHENAISDHPVACRHFPLEDFDTMARMIKEEADNGFVVTISIVVGGSLVVDYDERVSGGNAVSYDGNEKGH